MNRFPSKKKKEGINPKQLLIFRLAVDCFLVAIERAQITNASTCVSRSDNRIVNAQRRRRRWRRSHQTEEEEEEEDLLLSNRISMKMETTERYAHGPPFSVPIKSIIFQSESRSNHLLLFTSPFECLL